VRKGLIGEVVVEQARDERAAQRGQKGGPDALQASLGLGAQVPNADPPRSGQGSDEGAQPQESCLLGNEQVDARNTGGHVDIG
jgi:hypothetical protein